MRPTTASRVAAPIVATALLAGCGSSSHQGLTRAQLALRVDGICHHSSKAIQAIAEPKDFATNPVAAAAYLDQVSAVYRQADGQFAVLKPPSGVKARWHVVTSQLSTLLATVEDIDHKAHAKDPSGLTELEQLPALTHSLNQAFDAIGAHCSGS